MRNQGPVNYDPIESELDGLKRQLKAMTELAHRRAELNDQMQEVARDLQAELAEAKGELDACEQHLKIVREMNAADIAEAEERALKWADCHYVTCFGDIEKLDTKQRNLTKYWNKYFAAYRASQQQPDNSKIVCTSKFSVEDVVAVKDKAPYYQDMAVQRWDGGIVPFTIVGVSPGMQHDQRGYWLEAPGYGKKGDYGNGRIMVDSVDLMPISDVTPKQQPEHQPWCQSVQPSESMSRYCTCERRTHQRRDGKDRPHSLYDRDWERNMNNGYWLSGKDRRKGDRRQR